MRERGDVDAASRHIRSHEQAHLAFAQAGKHVFALALRKVGGKLIGIVAEALEHGRDVMHVGLGVAENDGRRGVLGLHQANEGAVLVHAAAFHEKMLDGGHVYLPLRKAEHLRIAQEFPGEVEYVLGIGGRKKRGKQRTPRQIALDLLHVRVEADGEHAVSFVEDESLERVQREGAADEMVEHAARRTHDELNAGAQSFELAAIAHAAVQRSHGKAGAFEKHAGFVFHLTGEFAGGGKDEGLRGAFLRIEQGKQGEQVRAGFAAARTGLHHDIAPCHKVGQCMSLHRHEAGPPGAGAGVLHLTGQFIQ